MANRGDLSVRRVAAVTLVLMLFLVRPAGAESDCEERFRRALESHIDLGDSVSALLPNGSWTRGRFDGLSADGLSVRMRSPDTAVAPVSHHLSDLRILKYRKTGQFRPDVMLAGLFCGAVIGALGTAAFTEDTCDGTELCIPAPMAGGVIGAGIGLTLGTIVPPMISSTRTVKCGVD